MKRIRLAALLIALAGAGTFAWMVWTVWPFTTDDSFITFRYARNLASGHGPTFNPGGPRVEGYTSVLWMWVMTVPHLLGWDAVLFSKVVGIGAMVGLGLVSFQFVVRLTGFLDAELRRVAGSVTVLMLGLFPSTAVHAISGMETALFAFLLQAFLYSVWMTIGRPGAWRFAMTAGLGLLTGLTRPEGNLPVVIAVVAAVAFLPKGDRLRFVAWVLGAYVVPGAIYFWWRWQYYGLLAPLPFYVKVASPTSLPGREMVENFILVMTLHAGVLAVLGVGRVEPKAWAVILPVFAFVGFFVFPAPIMDYAWRYLYPAVGVLFVLSGVGVGFVLSMIGATAPSGEGGSSFEALGLIAGVCVILGIGFSAKASDQLLDQRVYARGLRTAHVPLGRQLKALTDKVPSPVLAISDAGAVPYYADWDTIDTYGLNDAHIAQSREHDPEYVLDREPDVVVLVSRMRETFVPHIDWEKHLYRASLDRGMVRLGVLAFNPKNYYLWVMARSDSPLAPFLRTPD